MLILDSSLESSVGDKFNKTDFVHLKLYQTEGSLVLTGSTVLLHLLAGTFNRDVFTVHNFMAAEVLL